MSSASSTPDSKLAMAAMDERLAFLKQLHVLTNKIHACNQIDGIIVDLADDICNLFACERLTIYVVSDDKKSIVSKVKTGLNQYKDLVLAISDRSIAGFVALNRVTLNIRDVYKPDELQSYSPSLKFQLTIDSRTGFRSKQMLVAPLADSSTGELFGVIQLINSRNDKAFSTVTEEGLKELCETLTIALNQRKRPLLSPLATDKFGYLSKQGFLSADDIDMATQTAKSKNTDLGEFLITELHVSRAVVGEALSHYFGVPYEPFKSNRIVPVDIVKNLKRPYVEENQWLPVDLDNGGLKVLALNPEFVKNNKMVSNIFPKHALNFCVTTLLEFQQTLDQFFGTAQNASVDDILFGMEEGGEEFDEEGTDVSAAVENELVKLVNKIIIDAYQQGASDIHIEPQPGKEKTIIRFRKDGSLEPYIEIPSTYRSALLARIKIMCDLDISEKRRPQDGKIKFKKYSPLDIELRVATIPSAGGMEDVVMRILAAGEPIPLQQLGVIPHNLSRLKECIEKPYGIFFVCGPTGSGKTTTLHSILSYLNQPDTKIWTAEDPVEITQKGLRQVQVNRKAGMDFATVMRAFLRADPDIIMVGEMRDKETVSIGLEASLTGHLVFATLHTNSAPESIVRLLDMGMDPFNFADALLGILAQRLAKRLCGKCKRAVIASADDIQILLNEYCAELKNTSRYRLDPAAAQAEIAAQWEKQYASERGEFTLYQAVGCPACSNSGYKGRVGLHELMVGTDTVKKLLQEHARVADLLAAALEDGMLTLKMDGIEKVLSGLTDIKQVRHVCIK